MNSAKIKQFKTQAHILKPTVTVGHAGLTESVLNEIKITLETHELIKIKIRAERDERKIIRDQIISESKSELIQYIGQNLVIYKKRPPAKETKNTGPRRK